MEDGDETADETAEDFEEGVALTAQNKPDYVRHPCCRNQRIDELSTPNKRMFLALWNEHAYHLPKEKVKHLKQLLQQLYAMSPEETAKYFAELRSEARAAAMRRKLKQKLRKYLLDKHHQKQRERAYKLFKRLLKCGISYAAENPVPPLISIRLRYLSDIILEQLSDLRKVEMPNRSNPDKMGSFLISVADWMAIAVERLYYAAQLSINEITNQEQVLDETFMQVPKTYEGMGEPIGASTPKRLSLADETIPQRMSFLGEPIASSTPKRLSLVGEPIATSTPKRQSLVDQPIATSTPKRQPQDPYYSYFEPDPVATYVSKKGPQKVPHFTFSHMKPPPGISMLDKSHLDMPLYSFRKPPPANKSYKASEATTRRVGDSTLKSKNSKKSQMSTLNDTSRNKYSTRGNLTH